MTRPIRSELIPRIVEELTAGGRFPWPLAASIPEVIGKLRVMDTADIFKLYVLAIEGARVTLINTLERHGIK